MNDQDKIVDFLKTTGPSLPSKVAKIIHSEILLASAHLSDLSSQGKVKISKLKIGGSPLYYLSGQEEQLYAFASGNMNSKDLQVLDRLRNEKILRESALDLLSKVALRSLIDFAIPLHVHLQEKTELFWKWHLSNPEEVNSRIQEIINPPSAPAAESLTDLVPASPSPLTPLSLSSVSPTLITPEKTEKELQQTLTVVNESSEIKSVEEELVKGPENSLISETEDEFESQSEKESENRLEEESNQKRGLISSIFKPKKKKTIADTFFPQLDKYCAHLKIEIEQKDVLRKNAEINMLVKVPTVVGKMRYFCKAKNKSKCDEKDISLAYMEAQVKKIPLLFLYSEELTKKAQEMLDSGAFENAIVKKLS